MKRILILLLICLMFATCKKKEAPASLTGSPVFKFIGTIDGDSVNFRAGQDRMYMYSGYFKDTQNLITLKSYFGPDYCTNCEPYLSFEIKDFDVTNTNGLAGTMADLLQSGATFNSYSIDSVLSTTVVEVFSFLPDMNVTGTYQWDFGDGGTSNNFNPTYVFSDKGQRKVRLIVSSFGSTDTIDNLINTDFNASCRTQFDLTKDTITQDVSVSTLPSSGLTHIWDFGNGQVGAGATGTGHYLLPGKYTITLTSTGAGCIAVFKKSVSYLTPSDVVASYSYTTSNNTITAMGPRVNKSAFIISWKKDGKEYLSYKKLNGIDQSGNPVFTFTSILPYVPNEKGEKTVMVSGTVDTYLYNKDNWQDSIKIKSNEIVLAAAYPD